MKYANKIGSLLILSTVTLLSLFAGELMFRAIDGYELTSPNLVSRRPPPLPDPRFVALAAQYANEIRLDSDFRSEWFVSDFPSIESIVLQRHQLDHSLPEDWVRAVNQTSNQLNKEELRYIYNDDLVKKACSSGRYPSPLDVFKNDPGFVYTFKSPDDTTDPAFRFDPHWDLGSFVPNNFGFRGDDLAFAKPAGTIRVAFLGQSNTQDGWPNFVGLYLNKWAAAVGLHSKFEIINAGRAGVGIKGVARIMRYEVAPLRPDIVVVYVGATQLRAEDVLTAPAAKRTLRARERSSVEQSPFIAILAKADKYSALLNRISQLTASSRGVGEPEKPPHKLRVELSDPVKLDQPGLPFSLNEEITELRYIERATQAIHAKLFLTSSIVVAHEGLRLDLSRDYRIYDELNNEYWPLTYREVRSGADFENRAYRELSMEDHLGFLEIAKYFPQDPALFGDMIHLMDSGMNLQAWIVAEELAPVIREKVKKGEWPTQPTAGPHEINWGNEIPKKFDLSGCKKIES